MPTGQLLIDAELNLQQCDELQHLSLGPPGRVLMEPVNAPLIALLARLTGGGRLLVNVCRKKLGSPSWPSMV